MEFVKLNNGVEMPMMGFGTFLLGGEVCEDAVAAAIQNGYRMIDTAEAYGNEAAVGAGIRKSGIDRKELFIVTKLNYRSYENAEAVINQSLKNLSTDYVDLYYLHRVNPDMQMQEVAEAYGRLIADGLIRGWGLSQVSVEQLDEANRVTPVSAVQNLYNMLERDCEQDIFPYCLEHNISVVPFSPIASGFLSGKITADTKFESVDDVRVFVPQLTKENIVANQPIVSLLQEFAQKKNATSAQISLAWMLYKYPNVVPIPGSKNQERILENLGASEVILTEKEFAELETVLNGIVIHGHRGHVENEYSTMKDWKR